MSKMKKLLLTLLALAICLPTAAMATVDFPTASLPESWEGSVFKLTLESGYWLDVVDEGETIGQIDCENGMSFENVPLYMVPVPAGTQNAYLYTFQNDESSFVIGNSVYAAEATCDGGYVVLGNMFSVFQKLDATDVFIHAPELDNGDDPYMQTLFKHTVPVNLEAADGEMNVLLVEGSDYCSVAFGLYFVEYAMDTSVVPVESIHDLAGTDQGYSWYADRENQEILKLSAYVHPMGATNIDQITWECSDETIASISKTEIVRDGDVEDDHIQASVITLIPHKVGDCTLTVTCGKVSESVVVHLKSVPATEKAVDAIELSQTEAALWKFADGETIPTGYEAYADSFPASVTLTAAAKSGEETVEDAIIAWTSSDESVATVEDGVVTAVGAGEATITAAVGDVKAECKATVSDFVAPGYTNVSVGGAWKDSVNKPEAVAKKVIDLSDENQPHSFTIQGSAHKNVNGEKTLSSIQAMTWNVTDKNGCVTYTDDGNGNLTVTCTGKTGVVTFQPVLLNGYKNVILPLHITNGFVSEATIVRADGKEWVYDETVTINKEEHPVFVMEQGDEVSLSVQTDVEITHDYDGWMWDRFDESNGTYSAIQVKGENGAEYDLSNLKVGLYRILARVPMYEQDYIIEPLGMNKQDTVKSEWLYFRVKEKTVVISGDVSGDGTVDANDAVLVLQYAAQSATLTDAQLAAADLNDDGKVDANDAVLILQKIAG